MRIIASEYIVKHDTYSSAIAESIKFAEARGFEVDEEDIYREITVGRGKPKEGETRKHNLGLFLNGKKVKKALHLQIYRDTTYELNAYIL